MRPYIQCDTANKGPLYGGKARSAVGALQTVAAALVSPLSSAKLMSAAKMRSSDSAAPSPAAGRFVVFDRRFGSSAFDRLGQRLPSGLHRRHCLDEGLEHPGQALILGVRRSR